MISVGFAQVSKKRPCRICGKPDLLWLLERRGYFTTASGSPTTGPGTTSESSTSQLAGQTLLRNITLPSGTRAISIAVESNLNVPVQLVLLDPSGSVVQTANSSSGLIILEAPITKGGVYIIKTVNLSLGPVQIWSLTTPWMAK